MINPVFLMDNVWYKSFFVFLFLFFIAASVTKSAELTVLSSSASEFHFVLSLEFEKLYYQRASDSSLSFYESIQVGIPYGSRARLVLVEGRQLTSVAKDHSQLSKVPVISHPLVELSNRLVYQRIQKRKKLLVLQQFWQNIRKLLKFPWKLVKLVER